MLTTSTESSPSPSRRFAESSRVGYFSPVSASRSSTRVRRMASRSGMGHLPGLKSVLSGRLWPLHVAPRNHFATVLARAIRAPVVRVAEPDAYARVSVTLAHASGSATTPHPSATNRRQFHLHLVPLLGPLLADEAILAVVPSIDHVRARDAIVRAIASLAGNRE